MLVFEQSKVDQIILLFSQKSYEKDIEFLIEFPYLILLIEHSIYRSIFFSQYSTIFYIHDCIWTDKIEFLPRCSTCN